MTLLLLRIYLAECVASETYKSDMYTGNSISLNFMNFVTFCSLLFIDRLKNFLNIMLMFILIKVRVCETDSTTQS